MTYTWTTAVYLNAFAIIILLILLIDSGGKQHRLLLRDQLLFKWMLILNSVILALDAATWVLNGQTFPGARALNLTATTAFYILNPMMSFLYICYCDDKLGLRRSRRKRLILLYAIPLVVNLVLSLISIRNGFLFRIGEGNWYTRGSALYVSFFLSYFLLAVAFVRILRYRRGIRSSTGRYPAGYRRREIITLQLFPLVPLIGGALQILTLPITVVWLSTVLALVVLYINIQNSEIITDPLTRLYNRRQTDAYLQSVVQPGTARQLVQLAILDVDNFKLINDQYGHLTGDQALRTLASVLQAECDRDTFFSRYGGDEFVIITRDGGTDRLSALLCRISKRLEAYGSQLGVQYQLSISAGVAQWSDRLETAEALFAAADMELYRNKSLMKRRVSDRMEKEDDPLPE